MCRARQRERARHTLTLGSTHLTQHRRPRRRARTCRWATLSALTGQSVVDPKAVAAGLPPPDSLDMWPMLSGANATSPRATLVLRALVSAQQSGSIAPQAARAACRRVRARFAAE